MDEYSYKNNVFVPGQEHCTKKYPGYHPDFLTSLFTVIGHHPTYQPPCASCVILLFQDLAPASLCRGLTLAAKSCHALPHRKLRRAWEFLPLPRPYLAEPRLLHMCNLIFLTCFLALF